MPAALPITFAILPTLRECLRQIPDAWRRLEPVASKRFVSKKGLSSPNLLRAGGAEFFELSKEFTAYHVGDDLEIPEAALLDWMVNDNGVLNGGYSIRYYRSTLPEGERGITTLTSASVDTHNLPVCPGVPPPADGRLEIAQGKGYRTAGGMS